MTNQNLIESIQAELTSLVEQLGPAPSEPRPTSEACDIYSEIRLAKDRRFHALAAICYWCGLKPSDALEQEAHWIQRQTA